MASSNVNEALDKVIKVHDAIFAAAALQHNIGQEDSAEQQSTSTKRVQGPAKPTPVCRPQKTVCRIGVKRGINTMKGRQGTVRTPSTRSKVAKKSFSPSTSKKLPDTPRNAPSRSAKASQRAHARATGDKSTSQQAQPGPTSDKSTRKQAQPRPTSNKSTSQQAQPGPTSSGAGALQPVPQLQASEGEALLVSDYDGREGMCTQLMPDGYTRISFPGVVGHIVVPPNILGAASKAGDDYLRHEKMYRKKEEHLAVAKAVHNMAQYICHYYEEPVHYPYLYATIIHNKGCRGDVPTKLANQPEPVKTALLWACRYYEDQLNVLTPEQREEVLRNVTCNLMSNISNQVTLVKRKGLTALSETVNDIRPRRRRMSEVGGEFTITDDSRCNIDFYSKK